MSGEGGRRGRVRGGGMEGGEALDKLSTGEVTDCAHDFHGNQLKWSSWQQRGCV